LAADRVFSALGTDTITMSQENSVGFVTSAASVTFNEPLKLKSGGELPGFELVFETYGDAQQRTFQRRAGLSCAFR
jgi:homoserine acetyltransferase